MGVYFLDEYQRPYLQYDFQELTPGQMFLMRAIHREYDGQSDDIVEAQTFLFSPDEKQVILVDDLLHHQRSQQEATGVNMESNWEAYPAFGHYDSYCRAERG